jgi:hypothetical protein
MSNTRIKLLQVEDKTAAFQEMLLQHAAELRLAVFAGEVTDPVHALAASLEKLGQDEDFEEDRFGERTIH